MITTLALAPLGFFSIFSVYRPHDDEGYFLASLQDFLGGHANFKQVYGPFFYELMGGAFGLFGLDVNTDHGRVVTLVVWLLASVVGGIAFFTLTRSIWLGVAGQLLTFHSLSALTIEPMNPSGLIALLLISLAAVVANRSRSQGTSMLLIGSIIAAITLVKVNVGAFAALAVVLALAASPTGRWRRVVLPATGLAFIVAPLVVTSGLFSLEWVREFALLVSLSAASVVVVALAGEPAALRRGDALRLIAGGAAVTIVCLGIAAARGMRITDLIDAVLSALKFPGLFLVSADVGIFGMVWAALSLLIACGLVLRRSWQHVSPLVPAILRIAAGAFVLGSPLFLPSPLYLLALPLAWVAILRPTGDEENPADPTARLLLAALAVMASLEAYPVAGTQLWIAAVAVLPAGVVIFNDGLRQLLSWATARQSRSLMNVAGWLAPALVIVNVQVALLFGYLAASAYASGQSPGLPGTDLMRLPPAQASTLRSLAYEIDQDCANLLTMPGMPSINLWSERERISELDLGTWVFLLDASQQESVVGQIRAMPGLCVVRNHAVLDFWARGRPIPRRPLVEFIDTAFASTATFGDYELLIRKPG